ncbi:MAG: TauD/TfdA family dioxygenase [Hyphomicrobiaceae bacterium]
MTSRALPWTPDFERYAIVHRIVAATVNEDVVRVRWSDGRESLHHALWLRENSPDPDTIHPLSREMLLDPLDIPSDIAPSSAIVLDDGTLEVSWSHEALVSAYHPGWLRAHAYFDDEAATNGTAGTTVTWDASTLTAPLTFNGLKALEDESAYLGWLQALRDYGVARLEGLPIGADTLQRVVGRIGPMRATNFGRTFDVVVKDDPNSNAYTAAALVQHMDLATREMPPGLQFLFCRENSTHGGEGVYTDGFRIAADMKENDPAHFEALCSIRWEFKNRAKDCDYRAVGPVFAHDASGAITDVRFTPWLRAPLKASIVDQRLAYTAIRAFMTHNRDTKYQVRLTYRPGDLLAFDNRRILHGRASFDAAGGSRYLHGCYMDRDDLLSCIRTIERTAQPR